MKQGQPKKSNIMVLVLFIMFIVSVFGLLVSQYVTNLINISSLFQQYYKWYYYAYGGLELGLTLVKNHGFGYQEDISYNSFTQCARSNCSFDLSIISRTNTLVNYTTEPADCMTDPEPDDPLINSDDVYFNMPAGDALIIPLFWDHTTWFNYDPDDGNSFSIVEYGPLSWNNNDMLGDFNPTIYNLSTSSGSYIIRVIDEDTENYNVTLEPYESTSWYAFAAPLSGYEGDVDNKNYLIIANASWSAIDFCLSLDPLLNSGLYVKYIIIDSVASYGDTNAALRAAKSNPLPSFLGYGTIN